MRLTRTPALLGTVSLGIALLVAPANAEAQARTSRSHAAPDVTAAYRLPSTAKPASTPSRLAFSSPHLQSVTVKRASKAAPASPVVMGVMISVRSLAAAVAAAGAMSIVSTVTGGSVSNSPRPAASPSPVPTPAAANVTAKAPDAAVAPPVLPTVAVPRPGTPTPGTSPVPVPVGAAALTTEGTAADPVVQVGPDPSLSPVGDVFVPVGQLTQNLLDSSPASTTFVLATGTHRFTAALHPQADQAFIGAPGAIVSGAKLVTGWVQTASGWTVDGQTQRLPRPDGGSNSNCAAATPLCVNGEELFRDGVRLTPVATAGALRTGTFFFDYTKNVITVADDPTGHTLEATVAPAAFTNAWSNRFQNFTVEMFGNAAQSGAIQGNNLTISHMTIALNHGQGITQYGGLISLSRILSNGQLGIGGGGDHLVVDSNEIAHNNADGYDPGWEAGGAKWAYSTNLTVSNNWSHDNAGPGLWTDINNQNTAYLHNVVENNAGDGIVHEISYKATIISNIVRNNGTLPGYFDQRAGIVVMDSSNVEVSGNLISDNGGGGFVAYQDLRTSDGSLGPWQVTGLSVHDNVISEQATPQPAALAGLWVADGVADEETYYSPSTNRFTNNAYKIGGASAQGKLFQALVNGTSTAVNWSNWQAAGQDAQSAFLAP